MNYDEICRNLNIAITKAFSCKHCGGISEITPGNPNGYTKWCCDQAKEDIELERDKKDISRLESRGYQVTKKPPVRSCPKCKSTNIIMFSADEDACNDCWYVFFPEQLEQECRNFDG